MTTTTITEERDTRNKKLIALGFRAQALGLSAEQVRLIEGGTPEERAAYVRRQRNQYLLVAAIIAAYFVYLSAMPRPVPPAPPGPDVTDAGLVQTLQLHETAFSTSTTVTTPTGIYQVRGGVSATPGDRVTLKHETAPLGKTSLCVESKIKTRCYELL